MVYIHVDIYKCIQTETHSQVSFTQIVMVFILNQRQSCGLSNLVESQGTCNKKKSGKKKSQ